MQILIVDDEPDISFLLTLALEDAGYTVASVANGQAALERLRASTERPCLILLDLMMPPLNGWEFRAQQLADPVLASIPVVVLSAARPSDERAELLQAVAVLKKPVDFGFLNFSTLAQRKAACAAELELNRRLAPSVYLDVIAVTRDAQGVHQLQGNGEIVDWAVVMRRLPDARRADQLLRQGKLGNPEIDRLGCEHEA